jgi:cytochrome c biogenesis protein CcmG/thiol:disulfide interchange protein DsbE|tara:strand:+ start:2838 stop:3362 length:525 start_codon:yes stop_codon:yes gene_type:complete
VNIKFNYIILFGIPGFILLIFFLGLNTNNKYDTRELVGNQINNFKLIDIYENKTITNLDLKENNFTLINFWASWCSPCRAEHKYLMDLKSQTDLRIVGINFKDKEINAKNYLKELNNPYYFLAKDINGKISIKFGIYGIPESILVDRNLKIIKKYIGPINEKDFNEIIKIVTKL